MAAREKAHEKLAPLAPRGEAIVAAVSVQNWWGEEQGGPARGLASYWTERDYDIDNDVFCDAPYGFLGLTEDRLLVAKQTLFGSLKAKHLLLDAPAAACELVWYDRHMDKVRGTRRMLHLTFGEHRFGTAWVLLPGSIAGSFRDVVIAAADAVIETFQDRATHVPEPPDEWP